MNQLIPYLIITGVLFAIFTAFLACLVPWMLLSIKKSNSKSLAVLINIEEELKNNQGVNE